MEDTQKDNPEEAMTPRAGAIAGVQKHVWRGHQRETVTENDIGLGRLWAGEKQSTVLVSKAAFNEMGWAHLTVQMNLNSSGWDFSMSHPFPHECSNQEKAKASYI